MMMMMMMMTRSEYDLPETTIETVRDVVPARLLAEHE